MSESEWKKKSSIDTSQLEISVLEQKLWLVSLDRECLDQLSKILIQLLFFNHDQNDAFFSFTCTHNELSILVDHEGLEILKKHISNSTGMNAPVLSAHCWRAIQVFEGASLLNETGLIAALAHPLAQEQIEMIYCSTFESDLICVHEEKLELAHFKLQAIVSQGLSSQNSLKNAVKLNEEEMVISKDDIQLCLVKFDRSQLQNLTHPLLRELLFTREKTPFFSLTNSPREISCILNQASAKFFEDQNCQVSSDWSIVYVEETVGFAVGILSKTLADQGIPIYYLSTFNADLILVPSNLLNTAHDIIQKAISSDHN